MKKVLIIGPEFFDYNLSVERAFQNLGFATKVLGYFGGTVTSAKERIAYHLSKDKALFFEKIRRRFNDNVLQVYNQFKPDLVFIIQGNDVFKETVEHMTSSRKVLWMMDSIFRNKGGYSLRKSVDHIFLFEKTDIERLMETDQIRSSFLPLALDEKVYFPIKSEQTIDLLFVGALHGNRLEMLEKLAERFKTRTIQIYGRYYSPLRRPFYHLFRKNKDVFLNKNIAPSFVNVLYSRAKICLNMHHTQSRYGVNQRFFEICGSKAFQLVDTNPYITENFTSDEIMTYQTLPELFDKISTILEKDKEINTRQMAEKGYNKVLANHTFTHRIRQVLDTLSFN